MLRKGLPLSPESWGRKLASGERRGVSGDLGQTQGSTVCEKGGNRSAKAALGTLINVIPTTRPRLGGDLLKVSMETISASTGRE